MVGSLARLLTAGLAARAVRGSCGETRSCPAELQESPVEDVAMDAQVQLMQRTASLVAEPDEVVPPALASVMPIAWVHVPKCGSSFVNTLIHLPRVCNSNIPADLVVDYHMSGHFLSTFRNRYNVDNSCPGLMNTHFDHQGIDERVGYSKGVGHFMTFLRDPEQRIISAYHDMVMASRDLPSDTLTDPGSSWGGWKTAELPNLPDFAQENRGCVTRMLTRDGTPCGYAGGVPSDDELALAKRRLREGFVFVGITDQWDLSICLFSAMFKTGCHAYQFHNARPGYGVGDTHDTAQLEGVTDPYDGEVFAEALRIFNENLQRYNVSEASCAACYREASLAA